MNDPKADLSDEILLKGLQSEKAAVRDHALERLYVQHFPIMSQFIKKNSGNAEDASDIFQNAILAFYKKVRSGNLVLNCSIQTYLYSICRNLWLDELKARKKHQILVSELKSVTVELEPLPSEQTNERVALVMQLMDQLGTDCKKILGLFYFDRLRMKEIAEEMGYANEKVAKNLKGRCMKKLKELAKSS